jgi:hypothetical protein
MLLTYNADCDGSPVACPARPAAYPAHLAIYPAHLATYPAHPETYSALLQPILLNLRGPRRAQTTAHHIRRAR